MYFPDGRIAVHVPTNPEDQHNLSAPPAPPPPYAPAPPQQLGSQPGYLPRTSDVYTSAPPPGEPVYGYSESQTLPPPYYMDQTPQQWQTNMVVIGTQPSAVTTTVVHRSTGDNYKTLSIILTILCLVCGGWPSLLCTIKAIEMASAAKEHEAAGNESAANQKANTALVLNVTAVLAYIALVVIIITPIGVKLDEAFKALNND